MQAFQVVCLSATYYVDGTQGSDNNGGLSASDAWRTIQGAADRVTAGDTCIVLPGAYRERVRVGTSGRSGSPIVFEADGAVVTGGFTIQANYVHVRGFEITDTVDDYRDGTGIYVAGQYCVLEDNYIHDVTWEGINLYAGGDYDSTSTSHCTVRGNRIQRAGHAGMLIHGRDHLIEDNDISHSLQYPDGWSQSWADADGLIFFGSGHVIRGNHIHDIHQTAPENQGDPHIDAVQTWGPAYNIIFEKNRFEIPDYPEYSRIMQIAMIEELVSPVRDLTFRNNIFTNTGRGPNVWSCEGMVFVNNVLVNIRQYGIELHDSDNSVVENNIFYNVGDHSRAYVWSDSSADIGYNLHFMSDGGSPAGSPFPQDLWQRDPQFSDLSQGDFRLRASSPCIDSGVNVGVTADFAGNPVPQGDGPDIGAYEYAVVSSETYRLVVNASHGTVSQSPAQASYAQGETVTLSVVPEAGYSFVGWSGDLSGSTNPATVTMDADKSITAHFAEVPPTTYTLNTSGANGSVAKAPDKASYDEGETVTLTATPNTGYSFAGWSGDASGNSPSTTLTMDANKSVTADFTANTYTLTAGGANGSVTRAPDKSSYTHGETVTLAATPNTGYSFATWSGDASGTSPSTTVTMDGDKSVTANFAINTYTLAVNGTNGSVTSTPEKSSYTHGETVTLTATPNTGYSFATWSGDASGNSPSTTVTMDGDKSVTANFAINTYTLTVNGTNGSVASTPEKASYTYGETVTVQAVADSGYEFTGWSGDLSGGTNPVTVTMDANKSVTAGFVAVASTTYTLNTNGANGSVAKTPDKASYNAGETVTLAATPNTGYSFASWSGDLSGSSPSTTLTMDGNKSVTANFTANTYTLAAGGANGSVARAPDKSSYAHGETVTLTATANTGYSFATWSGDASGTSPSTTLTMDGDKFVTANFAINTYTLTVNGTNGSVTSTPEKASYTYGETVTVQAVADSGYEFTGWSGDLSGGTNPVTVTMDANKSVTAGFAAERADTTPPVAAASSPEADAVQVPLNSLVTLNISDDGEGVDANTVTISIDGTTVYSGSVSSYESAGGICRRTGTKNDYAYAYQSDADFDFSDTITIRANAADLNGNVMNQYVYSFETEMWAFGTDRAVSADVASGDKGRPVTASDNSGNLWVAWHAGAAGQRDVYLSKRGSGESNFADPIQLTSDAGDQANADLAIGADNRLYIVWQDNRRGNWDVYFRTSSDGANWSAETRITDSDDNQIVPVVAVDGTSRCHVAWQDDRDGHQDIYVAGSGDRFASATVARVTSHASDQTDPDIAVDASGDVYLLWTDARNGSDDIYGAASNSNSWANVAVVTGAGDQYAPALAAEDEGTRLHLAWTDDATGNSDVCYASADGMPVGPLAGVSVVDDTSGADQLAPALATAGSTGDGLRVFVCWQDWRNVTATGRDIDLYFVEVKETDETNVLVGDGGAGSDQSEPAVGVDSRGFPYVVWTDHRNAYAEIYYAGTMSRDSEVLHAQDVTASEGGTVGTISPSGVGDVSVVIPPAASSQDVTVTVREIENPAAAPASGGILSYEFGPSGLAFRRPVTMTIPYRTSEFGGVAPTPLWYDSQTGGLSQQGITDVERVTLAFGIEAIRFKTTHFTPYYLVSDSGMDEVVAGGSGGGGGGGGCSLSSAHDSPDPIAYFIPYMLIAAIVGALRLKDAKRRT